MQRKYLLTSLPTSEGRRASLWWEAPAADAGGQAALAASQAGCGFPGQGRPGSERVCVMGKKTEGVRRANVTTLAYSQNTREQNLPPPETRNIGGGPPAWPAKQGGRIQKCVPEMLRRCWRWSPQGPRASSTKLTVRGSWRLSRYPHGEWHVLSPPPGRQSRYGDDGDALDGGQTGNCSWRNGDHRQSDELGHPGVAHECVAERETGKPWHPINIVRASWHEWTSTSFMRCR